MKSYNVDWRPSAIEDMRNLFNYLAAEASLWDARHVTDRIFSSTEKLEQFPRLYQSAPSYGAGIRRISVMGQYVLYEVDDSTCTVKIHAVVGQRQQPKPIT